MTICPKAVELVADLVADHWSSYEVGRHYCCASVKHDKKAATVVLMCHWIDGHQNWVSTTNVRDQDDAEQFVKTAVSHLDSWYLANAVHGTA